MIVTVEGKQYNRETLFIQNLTDFMQIPLFS